MAETYRVAGVNLEKLNPEDLAKVLLEIGPYPSEQAAERSARRLLFGAAESPADAGPQKKKRTYRVIRVGDLLRE